jgi:hypothetical protein
VSLTQPCHQLVDDCKKTLNQSPCDAVLEIHGKGSKGNVHDNSTIYFLP